MNDGGALEGANKETAKSDTLFHNLSHIHINETSHALADVLTSRASVWAQAVQRVAGLFPKALNLRVPDIASGIAQRMLFVHMERSVASLHVAIASSTPNQL